MNNVHIDIRLEGDSFLPSKFTQLSNIPLEVIAEAGVIAKRGRYKGKPSPYGMALWNVDPNGDTDILISLSKNLKTLLKLKGKFSDVGIEDIIVDIDAPKEVSLGQEILSLITQLNARVEFNSNPIHEYDQSIRDIVEYISVRIDQDEQAKVKLNSDKANQIIKTLLNNESVSLKEKKRQAIRYLILYLSKSDKEKHVELSNINEVLD